MSGRAANFLVSGGLKKWCYNLSRFNQLGLYYDDCLYECPVVKKALTRLPQKLVDERTFRIVRAFQLSAQKIVLPKEQWTRYEDEVHYLQPYIDEVEREIAEKEEWDAQG